MDAPKSPYREERPLTEIIPKDRRREKVIALVAISMAAGAALWVLGGLLVEALRAPPEPQAVVTRPSRTLPSVTLDGPDGAIALPPGRPSVVHVWLEGCGDCMPAFEAIRDLEAHGGLGTDVPVINVAYTRANPDWAARYGVRKNLVFDRDGASVVKPLGVGTFTTLVVDDKGAIVLRDRPDRPGYLARVRAAMSLPEQRPSVPAEAAPTAAPAPDGEPLSTKLSRVVASHQSALRRTCWERRRDPTITSAKITVTAVVAPDGTVTSASGIGEPRELASCIERQVLTWQMPKVEATTSLQIPFIFVTQ